MLWSDVTRHAVIIDPGMMRAAEREMLANFIAERDLEVQGVLLTHCHVDHAASARWAATSFGVKVCASPAEAPLAQSIALQAQRFGLKLDFQPLVIDKELREGDVINLDDAAIQVLDTPGHTPGGLTFYIPSMALAMTGDSIFRGSVGRTDLPGGNMETLLDSIRRKILTLPANTTLAPGHGPATTVADEVRCNPYL